MEDWGLGFFQTSNPLHTNKRATVEPVDYGGFRIEAKTAFDSRRGPGRSAFGTYHRANSSAALGTCLVKKRDLLGEQRQ